MSRSCYFRLKLAGEKESIKEFMEMLIKYHEDLSILSMANDGYVSDTVEVMGVCKDSMKKSLLEGDFNLRDLVKKYNLKMGMKAASYTADNTEHIEEDIIINSAGEYVKDVSRSYEEIFTKTLEDFEGDKKRYISYLSWVNYNYINGFSKDLEVE